MVAGLLEVSTKWAYQWRRARVAGGAEEPPQTHATPHSSDRRLPHRNRAISTVTGQTLIAKGV
ncbi:hypothetical protein [Paractinoplanes atraurantiacus]|uniref:hypothetical protein n=1 Tax=Paractinoplanes atraurantiacus TaxID=1036182 RepID=UPI003182F840